MNLFKSIHITKRFSFYLGWFWGEEFKLFSFTLFDYTSNLMLVIFDIQIFKFVIQFIINLDE